MAGRVECYVHSDSVTKNKGACVVVIETQTDFLSNSIELISFAEDFAMRAYGISSQDKDEVFAMFGSLQVQYEELLEKSKEKIKIREIRIFEIS